MTWLCPGGGGGGRYGGDDDRYGRYGGGGGNGGGRGRYDDRGGGDRYGRGGDRDRYGGGGGGDRYGGGSDRGGGGKRPGNWRERELGGSSGGAAHLARIHGTEEDRVNCPFFFKIGACRHGDRCSRQHHKPPFSQTIIVKHMWVNPAAQIAATGGDPNSLDQKQVQDDFDDFFEEIHEEFSKYGRLEECNVCDNLGDHMVGNVYIKFDDEENAAEALQALHGRYYAKRLLDVEFSPVTDFREARCRQFDESHCSRGAYCNFMHIKRPSRWLLREIEKKQRKSSRRSDSRSRSRSRSPRSRSKSPRSPRDDDRDNGRNPESRNDDVRPEENGHPEANGGDEDRR